MKTNRINSYKIIFNSFSLALGCLMVVFIANGKLDNFVVMEKRDPVAYDFLVDNGMTENVPFGSSDIAAGAYRIVLSTEELFEIPETDLRYIVSNLVNRIRFGETKYLTIDLQNGYGFILTNNKKEGEFVKLDETGNVDKVIATLAKERSSYTVQILESSRELEFDYLSGAITELAEYFPQETEWSKVNDIRVYFKLLNNSRYTSFISVCGDGGWNMTSGINHAMNELGLEGLIGKNDVSYVALIRCGKAEYEKADTEAILYSGELPVKDKLENETDLYYSFDVESKGLSEGMWSMIRVNGREYWSGEPGICIVVYDNEHGEIVDSVRFSSNEEHLCTRE